MNSINYSSCYQGKLSKFPLPSIEHTSANLLELIHIDIWGPSPYPSCDGHHYFIIFIDDFTQFTWFYPVKFKSELFHVFQVFQKIVEK